MQPQSGTTYLTPSDLSGGFQYITQLDGPPDKGKKLKGDEKTKMRAKFERLRKSEQEKLGLAEGEEEGERKEGEEERGGKEEAENNGGERTGAVAEEKQAHTSHPPSSTEEFPSPTEKQGAISTQVSSNEEASKPSSSSPPPLPPPRASGSAIRKSHSAEDLMTEKLKFYLERERERAKGFQLKCTSPTNVGEGSSTSFASNQRDLPPSLSPSSQDHSSQKRIKRRDSSGTSARGKSTSPVSVVPSPKHSRLVVSPALFCRSLSPPEVVSPTSAGSGKTDSKEKEEVGEKGGRKARSVEREERGRGKSASAKPSSREATKRPDPSLESLFTPDNAPHGKERGSDIHQLPPGQAGLPGSACAKLPKDGGSPLKDPRTASIQPATLPLSVQGPPPVKVVREGELEGAPVIKGESESAVVATTMSEMTLNSNCNNNGKSTTSEDTKNGAGSHSTTGVEPGQASGTSAEMEPAPDTPGLESRQSDNGTGPDSILGKHGNSCDEEEEEVPSEKRESAPSARGGRGGRRGRRPKWKGWGRYKNRSSWGKKKGRAGALPVEPVLDTSLTIPEEDELAGHATVTAAISQSCAQEDDPSLTPVKRKRGRPRKNPVQDNISGQQGTTGDGSEQAEFDSQAKMPRREGPIVQDTISGQGISAGTSDCPEMESASQDQPDATLQAKVVRKRGRPRKNPAQDSGGSGRAAGQELKCPECDSIHSSMSAFQLHIESEHPPNLGVGPRN